MTSALAHIVAPCSVTGAGPRPRSIRVDRHYPKSIVRVRSTSAPEEHVETHAEIDAASVDTVEGILVDDDGTDGLIAHVPDGKNVRASRRWVLGGLGGMGAALCLTSSTSAIAAAAPEAARASSPAPLAEVAAATRATSAAPASSIAGYANLHDPRLFNGLATADRTKRRVARDGGRTGSQASQEVR